MEDRTDREQSTHRAYFLRLNLKDQLSETPKKRPVVGHYQGSWLHSQLERWMVPRDFQGGGDFSRLPGDWLLDLCLSEGPS